MSEKIHQRSNSALSWAGAICSILGLAAVIVLQGFEFSDLSLLFWWLTTAVIAIAAINACFTAPSLPLRMVFAIVFVAQMPAFDWAWGELHERDTTTDILFPGRPSEDQRKLESLEEENSRLRKERRESLLFWESVAHLTGMGFALLGCTAAGQRAVRIEYETS